MYNMSMKHIHTDINIELALEHYIDIMLWTLKRSMSDDEVLDSKLTIHDVGTDFKEVSRTELESFIKENEADLLTWKHEEVSEQVGHDFWLTRNHYGSGFCDDEWNHEVGQRLTASARKFSRVIVMDCDGVIKRA